jgi:hypothetical protein
MKESSNGILTAPSLSESAKKGRSGFVQVRGAREHNLKNVDLEIPRDALVVFTGFRFRKVFAGLRYSVCRGSATIS